MNSRICTRLGTLLILLTVFASCKKTVNTEQIVEPEEKVLLENIADLRNLESVSENVTYETKDFGGSLWKLSPSDNSTPDNTGTVIVTKRGRRLKRININSLNVEWFGAKGDGKTDNSKAFNDAFNSSDEVDILIPKGTYLISKPIIKLKGKLTITAWNSTIKLATTFPSDPRNSTGAMVLTNLTSIDILGLNIDGDRANLKSAGKDWRNYIMGFNIKNSSDISLKSCSVSNSPSISFLLKNCKGISVTECESTNGMYHGIEVSHCSDAVINRFKYIGTGNQGTNNAIGGIGMLATISNRVKFINCYVKDCPDTGTKSEGSNDVTWDGNTVINCGKDGIKFMNHEGDQYDAEVATVYNGTITNNTVSQIFNGRSDGSSEIQVWNAQDVVVSGNEITGGIKKGYEAGILIWNQGSGVTKNITVTDNRIKNTNQFIYLSNVSAVRVESNICESNNEPITTATGFLAENVKNSIVTKNVFKRKGTAKNYGTAVSMYNCSDLIFSENTVANAYTALLANFLTSNTVDLSNNTWDNFQMGFASIGASKSTETIQNLKLNNNIVSRIATGYFLKITTKNLKINKLNVNNTVVSGTLNDFGLQVLQGQAVEETDLTNFAPTGNALYPKSTSLKGCKRMIGLKSATIPNFGDWKAGDMVYSLIQNPVLKGWTCTKEGCPGTWKPF